MPKLARLYLDTARLGLMSPSAQLAARDFARLAGEGVSTLYFQKLLRGYITGNSPPRDLEGLAGWTGIGGIRNRLRQLLRLPASAPVLFASRTASLMRWAARRLWQHCQRVLVPDTAWPPYLRIVQEERGRGNVVVVPIRRLVQQGQIEATELTARIINAYQRQECDGLFLAAVSHDGVRIPTNALLTALRQDLSLQFAVIDGAQEPGHVPVNLTEAAPDVWLAGAHKWVGGHQPLGIACLANARSAASLDAAISSRGEASDDPLLNFLRYLEGHQSSDTRETVNLTPLFSTWGALRDQVVEPNEQASFFCQRLQNATLVAALAEDCGWQPIVVSRSLATGILLVQSTSSENSRLTPEALETVMEQAGVTTTSLGPGRLRLSLPAFPLGGEHVDQLERALLLGSNGRTTRRRSGSALTGTSGLSDDARKRFTAR